MCFFENIEVWPFLNMKVKWQTYRGRSEYRHPISRQAWNRRGMRATTMLKALTMLKVILVFDDDLKLTLGKRRASCRAQQWWSGQRFNRI
jgi:hypothetical protein